MIFIFFHFLMKVTILVFDCSAVTGCLEIFIFIWRSFAGNLDTLVVEAETNVGGVSQSQSSGSHGRSSIVNSSIRDGHMAVVEVGVGWNMAVVGDSRGNTMGVGGRQDSMAVGCGEDSLAVGGGEDSMAVGGWENSRVDNSGISFSFSLLHNMLEFTILGYITGEAQSLTKRSGVSKVVVSGLLA